MVANYLNNEFIKSSLKSNIHLALAHDCVDACVLNCQNRFYCYKHHLSFFFTQIYFTRRFFTANVYIIINRNDLVLYGSTCKKC